MIILGGVEERDPGAMAATFQCLPNRIVWPSRPTIKATSRYNMRQAVTSIINILIG